MTKLQNNSLINHTRTFFSENHENFRKQVRRVNKIHAGSKTNRDEGSHNNILQLTHDHSEIPRQF